MPDKKSIFVVDDDPAIHDLLRTELLSTNWSVESSRDLQDALTSLKDKAYDLVLTGMNTSGFEDVDLLRRLRKVRPHLKMIVMTAESTPEAVIQALRGHAFSYFSKPFSHDGLADMIEHALNVPAWDDGIEVLSGRPEWITLQVQCRMTTVERLVQFVKELETGLPMRDREDVGNAFREMLLNAVEHGTGSDPRQVVEVTCLRTSRIVLYEIRDPGEGFALDSLPHAAISNPHEGPFDHATYRLEHGMRPGGFGILLTRNLVDELLYNEKGNQVVLIKYLQGFRQP
jgi:CheY-like chemotaxis protein